MTSKIEHFKDQSPHMRDGVANWYVLTDIKTGTLEVYTVPTTDVDSFLEGTEFTHMSGLIPRFDAPRKKSNTVNIKRNASEQK